MTTQTEIDFLHKREYTADSENNLKKQGKRFNKQAQFILDSMMKGERWTNLKAKDHGIMQLQTRIWELINNGKIPVQKRWIEIEGVRYKEYFI